MNAEELRMQYANENEIAISCVNFIPETEIKRKSIEYIIWLEKRLITESIRNEELQKDADWLRCLEAAGVDNWEGYGVAQDYRDENV